MLHQKDKFYKYVLPLKKVSWLDKHERREKNVTTSNIYILRKRAQKLENMLFLDIITTFDNFALIIEASWAEAEVKPILETEVSMFS